MRIFILLRILISTTDRRAQAPAARVPFKIKITITFQASITENSHYFLSKNVQWVYFVHFRCNFDGTPLCPSFSFVLSLIMENWYLCSDRNWIRFRTRDDFSHVSLPFDFIWLSCCTNCPISSEFRNHMWYQYATYAALAPHDSVIKF